MGWIWGGVKEGSSLFFFSSRAGPAMRWQYGGAQSAYHDVSLSALHSVRGNPSRDEGSNLFHLPVLLRSHLFCTSGWSVSNK